VRLPVPAHVSASWASRSACPGSPCEIASPRRQQYQVRARCDRDGLVPPPT
jgi:hypothetical protein